MEIASAAAAALVANVARRIDVFLTPVTETAIKGEWCKRTVLIDSELGIACDDRTWTSRAQRALLECLHIKNEYDG